MHQNMPKHIFTHWVGSRLINRRTNLTSAEEMFPIKNWRFRDNLQSSTYTSSYSEIVGYTQAETRETLNASSSSCPRNLGNFKGNRNRRHSARRVSRSVVNTVFIDSRCLHKVFEEGCKCATMCRNHGLRLTDSLNAGR